MARHLWRLCGLCIRLHTAACTALGMQDQCSCLCSQSPRISATPRNTGPAYKKVALLQRQMAQDSYSCIVRSQNMLWLLPCIFSWIFAQTRKAKAINQALICFLPLRTKQHWTLNNCVLLAVAEMHSIRNSILGLSHPASHIQRRNKRSSFGRRLLHHL